MPVPTSSEPKRVLIVEDDAANREVMQLVLELAGHTVSTAGSCDEALRRAEQDNPDTVLLDLTLPDRDGSEVSAALRARGGDVPRIIITSGMPLDGDDVQRLGGDAILQKPFCPEALLAALR